MYDLSKIHIIYSSCKVVKKTQSEFNGCDAELIVTGILARTSA